MLYFQPCELSFAFPGKAFLFITQPGDLQARTFCHANNYP